MGSVILPKCSENRKQYVSNGTNVKEIETKRRLYSRIVKGELKFVWNIIVEEGFVNLTPTRIF